MTKNLESLRDPVRPNLACYSQSFTVCRADEGRTGGNPKQHDVRGDKFLTQSPSILGAGMGNKRQAFTLTVNVAFRGWAREPWYKILKYLIFYITP
jgi:hypothetical protein